MKTRYSILIPLHALAVLIFTAAPARAAWKAEDEAMLSDVYARLVAVADPPPGVQLPTRPNEDPKEVDVSVNNACAWNDSRQAGKVVPRINIFRGIMEKVVEGHPGRLAFITGHEMGHVIRGHIAHVYRDPKDGTMFLHEAFGREQEYEADQMGIKLALRAGYSFSDCVDAMRVFADSNTEYSAFRGQMLNHPSWKERLARVDTDHAALWTAMASFHSGVDFLEFEQFGSAAVCFEEVVKEFPECPEGWANLGYSQLMAYCDTLTPSDLRKLDINQMVIGGFYHRPEWLRGQAQRGDSKLWEKAKTSLEKALTLKPDLSLTKANLGVVWLVAPDGKDLAKASKYLNEAVSEMSRDKTLVPSLQAAMLVNAGVSDFAGGEDATALDRFNQAISLMNTRDGRTRALASSLRGAVLYNKGVYLAGSSTPEKRREALETFQEYFTTASPSGAWWPLAYEKYAKLAKDLGVPVIEAQTLQSRATDRKRPITSVTLEGGVELVLGANLADVEKRLGKGIRVPVIPGYKLVAITYPELGVKLIGIDTLLAISLTRPTSPAVMVQPTDIGAVAQPVRVGMSLEDLDKLVGAQHIAMEAVFQPKETYVVYRDLQVAFRVNEGRIIEVVVALIPETPKEEKE